MPEKWEVAHDFVARLLQPLLKSWRTSAWQRSRPFLVPVPLGVLLAATVGLIVFYPALHEQYVRAELANWTIYIDSRNGLRVARSFGAFEGEKLALIAPLLRTLSVVELDLPGTKVASLGPLKGLTGLRRLNLSNTQVADLEPLKGLTALQELDLPGTKVASLGPLKGLTALQELDLSAQRSPAWDR
jgi:hypothetical protein